MADAEELRNNTSSDVYVQTFKEKDVTFLCANESSQLAEVNPNRHTSHPSRSHSNVVADISGCPLGEEDDGPDIAKEQKIRHGSES